ncbi:unnamed protein product [Brassicogethes aeneus]|uniref:5'-3' exoribonuclease 1 n=1 Tax=Brassicogethes aeneus TaxID=1431903 RepID=A0A9P0B7F9_BRAAE|nr:unnamed protein product [Brassicogethes aeneus]
MGVPKFFRYISERYPCLSELVKEYQLPEFDNLYLDMNGIIHNCSHPDDNNPHFRITEEKIFQDIFHYIEVLFRMIRPQQLFFMAVDGVAPRAKMNQQRGRRFRSAKDAEKMEKEAKSKGEKLPDTARFDSNCITPGTPFMYKLQEALKYFVVDKISNDPLWKKCKVILSGHETPGEGEHKIMDYIRYMRAQPGYDPNTRHCLYGLDADLIMLGLCTHEPHFSLLREEVKFGRKSTKKISVPEEITFFLLHLSLMREYLELEFKTLEEKLQGFQYDFEKIIDDWVLMGFLVGNDFIPHLPNLHIANGALPILYKAYSDVLPELGGYINEGGKLNLERFEKFMEKLSKIDMDNFEDIQEDITYMESKTGRKFNPFDMDLRPDNLQAWKPEDGDDLKTEALQPENDLAALIKATDDMFINSSDDTSDDDDAFDMYKKEYYRTKMEYAKVTPEVMRDQAEGYVKAIQWNLNYYYNGCCSWSWYYPHHYAPYISDIKGFTNLKIEFDLGNPFKPFEQLLAVLPSASKMHLPEVYHGLMTDDISLIKQYYPEDFQTDLNGKKQEWEAVVLVPFIDENLLLEAMAPCNQKLSLEEQSRNKHGPMCVYRWVERSLGSYQAPDHFKDIGENHAFLKSLSIDDIRVPVDKLVKGAYPGVKMNVYYPGFPTLKHLNYRGELKLNKIKVFDQPSRNENMVIKIIPDEKYLGDSIPVDLLGTTIFVGWPHLVEAKVIAISNSKRKYVSMGSPGEYDINDKLGDEKAFKYEYDGIIEYYKTRMGIDCGETKVLMHVQVMIGRRYVFSPQGRLSLDKQFAKEESRYPLQTTVFNIDAYDSHNSTFKDIHSVLPIGSECFLITNPYYGSQGTILDSSDTLKNGRLKVCISVVEEPDMSSVFVKHEQMKNMYMSTHTASQTLGMPPYLFSKITGCVFITARNNEGGLKNVNGGLDLKFNKRNKEIPGYTKKYGNTWVYTAKAVDLVLEYCERFPELVQFLSKGAKQDGIAAEILFGDNWDVKMKELNKFLKELPTHSIEKRTCGSEAFEKEIVDDIEKIIDSQADKLVVKKVTMQVKPGFLYRPELQSGTLMPDPTMRAEILDRIVNVRTGYTVPFGLKGTIIAIQEPSDGNDRDILYDVVFDKSFRDGMTLNCSEGRGYRLPSNAFINLTHGKRKMEARTGKPGDYMGEYGNKTEATERREPVKSNNFFTPSAFASVPQSPQNQKYPPDQPRIKINPQNIKVQTPPKGDFMPDFGGNASEKKGNNRNRNGNKVPNQPLNMVPRVDTDMLKKLLKIGSDDNKNNKPTPKPTETMPPLENKINVADIFANAGTATVRLLTYFQSNNLGLPRYQYFEENNGIVAQLILPPKGLMVGKLCSNREEASESVAEAALNEFMKKGSERTVEVVNNFPAPPKTWVQPPPSAPHPKRDSGNNSSNSKSQNGHHNKSQNLVSTNSFIPTQALKRQAQKNAQHGNSSKHTGADNVKSSPSNTSLKENKQSPKKNDRPRRERKTRIAANFCNQ